MKLSIQKPRRRRSQTRLGRRPRSRTAYAALPISARRLRLRIPSLGLQRNAAAILSAFLVVALLTLFILPDYAISSLEIKGNRGTPTQELADAIGFARGLNAFLVNRRIVEQAALAVPGVQKAQARVILPNRLELIIKDSPPEVLWIAGNQLLWLTASGIVRDAPPAPPEHTLTIRDLSGRTYKNGDQVDQSVIKAAQELSVLLGQDIKELQFLRDGELLVVSMNGWRALFSTRRDIKTQLDSLRALQQRRSFVYADVRVPNNIVYE